MIVNMKFLSITGPKDDIDIVVDKYLSKYEIQLEPALSELKDVHNLRPFIGNNPYKDVFNKSNEYIALLNTSETTVDDDISTSEAIHLINDIDEKYKEMTAMKENLEVELSNLLESAENIRPFRSLDYHLPTILGFHFIKFAFGKMPVEQYENFVKYIYDDLDTLFVKCDESEEYVWGVYFVPRTQNHKIDAVFSSLHFERTYLPKEFDGTPNDVYLLLQEMINAKRKEIEKFNDEFKDYLETQKQRLLYANKRLEKLTNNYNVRKYAACTQANSRDFFILCGWVSAKDAKKLSAEIAKEADNEYYCIIDDEHNSTISTPPTRLKNPGIFKPFEMYIRMYGLPAYNEFDPTIFVALTYSFIFGAMFGDVGQGLCLFLGGLLLYKLKKMNLAAIVSCAGIFSTFFGFMFGSVFGFEDIIEAKWLHPASHMTTLPFIGKMNTVFVVAIAFGMFLILVTMVLHIINAIKSHDIENIFFDTNGLAGLVFYGSLALVIVLFMSGKALPAGIILVVMFVVPLLLIALKEPLTRLIEKKSELIPGGKGMFFVQTFFELFEVLLSYFSNTLSFVRVGAFAISHAAMMEVVLMLSGYESGNINWIVVVLGNIFVCGMEGLIVGIQVLRLEYYEMFSRFYKGTGREFVPYKSTKN